MSKFLSQTPATLLKKIVQSPILKDYLIRFLKSYFRLRSFGTNNIPKEGPVIIVPNHSGFAGLDAIILAHEIHKKTRRNPKIMTHFLWFLSKTTAIPAQSLGFIEANSTNGINLLKKGELIVLFPEGESGNFKPTSQKYQLQEFKRGFVRWAISTGTPIIPTLIIGAEESQVNLTRLEIPIFIRKLILPLPLNIIPLPSKWNIIFFPAIHLPYGTDKANDNDLVHEITLDIHEKMQDLLIKELQKRKSTFF